MSGIEVGQPKPVSPHNQALYEAGKQILVESISVGREFCKFMVGVSTGAIPLYLALLQIALPKDYRPGWWRGVLAIVPGALFLAAAIVFAVGVFPRTSTFSLDIVEQIETARSRVIARRRNLSIAGFALFTIAALAGIVITIAALEVTTSAAPEVGQMRLEYAPPDAPVDDHVFELIRRSRVFDVEAVDLNARLKLPRDLIVSFRDGQGPGYNPGTHTITMPYSFLRDERDALERSEPHVASKQLDRAVLDIGRFVFFHELGHALVDLYGLPIVAKEEDAVDSFAAILTTDVLDDPSLALATAHLLAIHAFMRHLLDARDFKDSHSLDAQRFYSITCLVYGSDIDRYAALAHVLSQPRANGCVEEYRRASDGWRRLLPKVFQ